MKIKTNFFLKFSLFLFLSLVFCGLNKSFSQGVRVIVLDPGHGGHFPGAVYKGVKEKDLNLDVALRLGNQIKKKYPQIKVVYTRTKDVALAKDLKTDLAKRSKIANDANGDLFISIHANAATSTSAKGAETIIMGESSLEKQRNDAALYTANKGELIDMSDQKNAAIVRAYIQNLQYTYGQYSEALARLIQSSYAEDGRTVRNLRRQPIMVLYGTDMPCVLTEIGFMSNASEFAYIKSSKGKEEVAHSILGGISAYIDMVNQTAAASSNLDLSSSPSSGYTIQIISSRKPIANNSSHFKSYKGQTWERKTSGRFAYKYCVGRYETHAEAQSILSQVRRSFKDAFITKY